MAELHKLIIGTVGRPASYSFLVLILLVCYRHCLTTIPRSDLLRETAETGLLPLSTFPPGTVTHRERGFSRAGGPDACVRVSRP